MMIILFISPLEFFPQQNDGVLMLMQREFGLLVCDTNQVVRMHTWVGPLTDEGYIIHG